MAKISLARSILLPLIGEEATHEYVRHRSIYLRGKSGTVYRIGTSTSSVTRVDSACNIHRYDYSSPIANSNGGPCGEKEIVYLWTYCSQPVIQDLERVMLTCEEDMLNFRIRLAITQAATFYLTILSDENLFLKGANTSGVNVVLFKSFLHGRKIMGHPHDGKIPV